MNILLSLLFTFLMSACTEPPVRSEAPMHSPKQKQEILVGASDLNTYLPKLEGKRVGLLINHSSYVGDAHLIDLLLSKDVDVTRIFVPEHGYRGIADAGEIIDDGKDPKSGIPISSLYGENKKPKLEDLENVDLMIYDIQDVGVRFYTYISSLHYMMEACAESNTPLIVLDRPNPNGFYVDGPTLDMKFQSFVGMHAIPVVYGMTPGELAKMINGEGWLNNNVNCSLEVIPCINYAHHLNYSLPIKPSPNLPNDRSVQLYPSLCFLEATVASVGRGTKSPFQIVGLPMTLENFDTLFVPQSMNGAKNPKHLGRDCYGYSLRDPNPRFAEKRNRLNLTFIIELMKMYTEGQFIDRPDFFDKLAGTDKLRMQLEAGQSEEAIRQSWQEELEAFKVKRSKYLIYD
ncbi:MAG: DUF1343 domain-containing protein [Chitinophagales bacterium]|nr:DUF1343 domain-containing protein [Chitinophagales bacterium]